MTFCSMSELDVKLTLSTSRPAAGALRRTGTVEKASCSAPVEIEKSVAPVPGYEPDTEAGAGKRALATDPGRWSPHLVSLRAGNRLVLDPEDGRVGTRRDQRHIVRRPSGARSLHRVVAALGEHGTVRKARPVRLRGAV